MFSFVHPNKRFCASGHGGFFQYFFNSHLTSYQTIRHCVIADDKKNPKKRKTDRSHVLCHVVLYTAYITKIMESCKFEIELCVFQPQNGVNFYVGR